MKNARKATVTDEHRKEAAALKAIWDSTEHAGQAAFGETFNIGNQSAVSQFLNANVPLSLEAAAGFAKGLSCNIEDFSPRLARLASHILSVLGKNERIDDTKVRPLAKQQSLGPLWPFRLISEEKVQALDTSDLARLEGAWAVTAMHIGIDVRQTRQSQAPQAPAETRPSVPAKRITPDGGGILYEKTIPPSNLSLRPGYVERSTADRASDPPKSKIRRFPK